MVQGEWTDGTLVRGYLAAPASGTPRAGLVLSPSSEGATDTMAGVARAFAKAGYAVLLVDPFAREGGTRAVPEADRPQLLAGPEAAVRRQSDIRGAASYLAEVVGVPTDALGLLGLGFGGVDAWEVAKYPSPPAYRAVVLFSTLPNFLMGAEHVRTPVLAHYGALDRSAAADLPVLERRLGDAGIDHTVRVHAASGRAFWLNANAAEAVMRETLDWLKAHHLGTDTGTGPPGVAPSRGRRRTLLN